jgi:hypothetical protein
MVLILGCTWTVLSAPITANAASPLPGPGYWFVGADGGVFSFGAPFYGSGVTVPGTCGFTPQPPSTLNPAFGCSAMTPTPTGNGYWILNAYRSGTGFGLANLLPGRGCTSLNGALGSWTGIASSVDGSGFLMVSTNGGVAGCGDAAPMGGLTSLALAAPIVGMAATPSYKGYWLVSGDGGVFAFGNAAFKGSMGGTPLNARVVGIAATADGGGYWLTSADGGVFAFGDAAFKGSMGGSHINAPVVGIAATPDGNGYWLAAADGGIFSFGTAPFEGSMGGTPLTAPIVGIATYRSSASG